MKTNIGTKIAATAAKAKMTTQKAKLAIKEAKVYKKIKELDNKLKKGFRCLLKRLGRLITLSIIFGILLNVAIYFWPQLPEKIPTIYGFYNGVLELVEFSLKTVFGLFASLFNGTFFEFSENMFTEIGELWNAFWSWCSSLTF